MLFKVGIHLTSQSLIILIVANTTATTTIKAELLC